ncbi:hypothetical protein J2X07_000026 [Fictibacillus barbaricus]|uniref:Uncharacterized protein n=1 Tax=Fictibacillus barbaricus TaxID=182136 RepID=A0ABU1TV22_9BACL|nr:hypothetical protein [Fictibacillus barbaricus]
MVFIFLYGLAGIVGLFLIIHYAVRSGIDHSNKVRVMRIELKEIKKLVSDLSFRKSNFVINYLDKLIGV